jgi:tRNA-2-methylthio-N6-dimethylallyladenosine synthase
MVTPSTEPFQSGSEPQVRFLYIKTFGCQMNEYDSLRMFRILHSLGYSHTTDMARADVILLNTCSVREKAEQKVHSFVGRLRQLKTRRPGLKIVVAGCVAQQLGEQLLERFKHLDLVLGTRGIPAIAKLLQAIEETRERLVYLPAEETEEPDSPATGEEEGGSQRLPAVPNPTIFPGATPVVAPVTIMQGCDNYCSYCIVPYVRGREHSRPLGDILTEIHLLTAAGIREILLLGQNVNSYGRGSDKRLDFVHLLRSIQAETDVSRIRFTTSHPKDLTPELIQCFNDLPALCSSLHLPVQAGSDRILALMNRGYKTSQYLEKISLLRRACPDIGLSSDVMVGFPGETEEDFQQTLQLLDTVQFDNLFSFRYSDRPHTKASGFPNKVDSQTRARRLTELQSFQAGITLRKNHMEIGRIREILVEGPSRAGNAQLTGRTRQNRTVNFHGSKELIGKTIYVKISSAHSHSLEGKLRSEREDSDGPDGANTRP